MADNSPVAHEGNPKEDTITITGGSVLSTATLTIFVPPISLGESPILPPPLIPPPGGGCADCSEVVATTVRHPSDCSIDDIYEYYMVGSYTAAAELNGTHTGCDIGNGSSSVGDVFDITIASGINGCPTAGFSLWKATPRFGAAEFSEHNARYYGPSSGQPITGFCASVVAGSTVCSFTGYVCLFDHKNSLVVLGYYINADISRTYPTVVATAPLSTTYPNNIWFDWLDNPAGDPNPSLEFADDFGSTVWVGDGTISPGLFARSTNMGIIWIGNADSGSHIARWTSNGINWFVD